MIDFSKPHDHVEQYENSIACPQVTSRTGYETHGLQLHCLYLSFTSVLILLKKDIDSYIFGIFYTFLCFFFQDRGGKVGDLPDFNFFFLTYSANTINSHSFYIRSNVS